MIITQFVLLKPLFKHAPELPEGFYRHPKTFLWLYSDLGNQFSVKTVLVDADKYFKGTKRFWKQNLRIALKFILVLKNVHKSFYCNKMPNMSFLVTKPNNSLFGIDRNKK